MSELTPTPDPEIPAARQRPWRWGAAWVFAAVFLVHAASPITTSADSRYAIHVARSIVLERNTDLDEYRQEYEADRDGRYCLTTVNGHLQAYQPVGPSLLAVPFVAMLEAGGRAALT